MRISKNMRSFFSTMAATVVASLAVVGIVIAATTIGSNIYSTGGALFNQASTTALTVQDGSGTAVMNVDTTNGGLKVTGAATSTTYMWVGSGGTNNNLSYTGGNLYVQGSAEIDGVLYMNRATSTSATSTDYLYLGPDFTEPAGFNFQGGDLAIASDLLVGSKATSTVALWVGSAGNPTYLNLAGGDAYIQDALEVDGTFYFVNATGTAATTTDYLYIGPDFTEPAGFNFQGGDLAIASDLLVGSKATSTVMLWVGSAGTANYIDAAGGDLYVQGDAEFDGIAYFNRATSTSATSTDYLYIGPDFTEPSGFNFQGGDLGVAGDVAVGGNATTTGNLTIGDAQAGATTTVEIGDANTAGCLKIRDADADAWSFCYIENGALTCSASDNCAK